MAGERDTLESLLKGIERARSGIVRKQRQADREDELRECLQQLEVKREAQLSSCQAFKSHVVAEISRLQGLKADVDRRAAALDEMYALAAEQLTQAYIEANAPQRDESRE
jgi:hypothetical protein